MENHGGEWKAISNGLPESRGTIIAILAANQKIVENSMPLTTAEYFALLIQVLSGESSMYHGPKNIFYNILGH